MYFNHYSTGQVMQRATDKRVTKAYPGDNLSILLIP